jgi:hypothetical protein
MLKQIHFMKKNILLLVIICFFSSVTQIFAQKENRKVGSFSRIDFKIAGKLYVTQGATEKVEIDASKDLLEQIETKVEGSKLVIHMPGSRNWNWKSGDDDVKVYITVKTLEGLYVSGSGDVIGQSKFTTGDLDLKVSGSGSMEVEIASTGQIDADVSGSGELNVKGSSRGFNSNVSGSGRVNMAMNVAGKSDFGISGSGKIQASGKTEEVDITISGSGKVLGADLETNRCDVRISGSGNVEINVKDELDSHISGSGSVSYKGNPSKINNNSSGSGSLHKM